ILLHECMNISMRLLLLCFIVISNGNCQIDNGGMEQLDTPNKSQYHRYEIFDSSDNMSDVDAKKEEANSTLTNFEDEMKSAETDVELKRKEVDEAEKSVELERIHLEQVKGIEDSKKEIDAANRVYLDRLEEWKWHNDKLIEEEKHLSSSLTAVKNAEEAYRAAVESHTMKSEELREFEDEKTEFENNRDTALDE
ncbi:hypothetical protein PFISCL1PPCAC_25486, partial [Pristionchus fissidentatus]